MPDQQPALRELPGSPNPYTDAAPLVVRDHPWRDNRAVLVLAAVVLAMPLILLGVRAARGERPLLSDEAALALVIGAPLAVLIALFPLVIASRAKVKLGASTLTRSVAARRGATRTIALTDLRGGIYASQVRYRRETGKELVLFLPGREIVWIADGIAPADIEGLARSLTSYGIREYADPITNERLQALVHKARQT